MNRNSRVNILLGSVAMLLLIALTGCREKRISYVDMIKRETKEIEAFMSRQNFKVVKELPENKAMPANEYAEILEGVYLNVSNPGNGNKAVSGKTVVSARFTVKSISDPDRGQLSFSNYGTQSGGTHPLPFVYYDESQIIQMDPNATTGEKNNNAFLCAAMLEAMKHVSEGAHVSMIVSFREGPNITSEKGIALYFEDLQLDFKK